MLYFNINKNIMSLYNTTNVKSLPSVEQVLPGNFLIIEDEVGTKKLNFTDFVVGPNNTSFYTPIDTRIKTVSSTCSHLLSSKAYLIQGFSTPEGVLGVYRPGAYTFTTYISVANGYKEGTLQFLAPTPNIIQSDLIVGNSLYLDSFCYSLSSTGKSSTIANHYTYNMGLSTKTIVESDTIFSVKIILFDESIFLDNIEIEIAPPTGLQSGTTVL
jgi:hypothetical protein